ncbi:arsenite methyltransferase [Desulfoferrobacter suflitae]|uniref:arsenite methyltransferase n=1 Tax=Desulfoferrobacter suflitae TaxID=2865782 RepID=UPI0021649FB8|nr:arsenite methyltransferase [Desulfoferrobacter suflitae]MCK8604262.1 arsenite methyltransferase [Desulfoferrobacter suflitae]
MKAEEIKKAVQSGYAKVALQNIPCCGSNSSCCGSAGPAEDISKRIGYSDEELQAVPDGSNLGLGCGNPVALASLKEGEVVLDLGSGAGFDCFLAASKVGPNGRVIGVDMTPEMIEKARRNAAQGNFTNVEFRLGEIESLPVSDNQVDIIISNCVINLSPDKGKVFREAFRVLKPRGRLMVSDMVLLKELPEVIRRSIEAYVGCIAGALMKHEYLAAMEDAGFLEIKVVGEDIYPIELISGDPTAQAICSDSSMSPEALNDLATSVASIKVFASKPA